MSVFNTMDIPVKRITGQYVKGVWEDGEPELLTFRGTLQPADITKIQVLAGGRRVLSAYEVITGSRLKGPDPVTGYKGDLVTIDGMDHVLMTNRFHGVLIPHTEAIAVVYADSLGQDAIVDPATPIPEPEEA